MEDKTRLNLYLRVKTRNRVEALAERLGKTRPYVAVLALEAGLDLLELSTSKHFATLMAKHPEMMEELQRMAYEAEYSEAHGNEGVEQDRAQE